MSVALCWPRSHTLDLSSSHFRKVGHFCPGAQGGESNGCKYLCDSWHSFHSLRRGIIHCDALPCRSHSPLAGSAPSLSPVCADETHSKQDGRLPIRRGSN